jgi:hypothetical protein
MGLVDHRHRAATPGVTNGTAATLAEAEAKFRDTWTKARLARDYKARSRRADTGLAECPQNVSVVAPNRT